MADLSFRDRVSLLLNGLEEGREVRAYLRRFGEGDGGCFAVIKVGGAILDTDMEALAEALSLLQFLGLPPVVVYGAGPQLDDRLAAAGIPEERRDGYRVTPAPAIPLAAAATGRMGLDLAAAMRRLGASAALVHPGTVEARALDPARYGMVGDVASVDTDGLSRLLAAGAVPLVGCIHPDASGQLLNINADNLARGIAEQIRPKKIVFVTGTGGILDASGAVVSSINLASDREALFAASWLKGGMRHKLAEIAALLERLPPASSVSITRTDGLVRELFTHSGSGTLIRRGEAIEQHDAVARAVIEPLIESAFGRPLKPGYWHGFAPDYCLLSEHRRAGAVVLRIGDCAFLDKFAVMPDARGEGLAKALWQELVARSPRLVWRSRRSNPFNGFYHGVADGSVRRDPWTVFWCGPDLEAAIPALADRVAARPPDFQGDE